MRKLIYGVGYYEAGAYVAHAAGKKTREYMSWAGMLDRCYGTKLLAHNATYVGCTISDKFKNFQSFAEWANLQTGFENDGWQLEKDIILRGNKVYSEDVCVFVPLQINSLLCLRKSRRGVLPLGVSMRRGKYQSQVSMRGKVKNLGSYSTPEEAFSVYKCAKENAIRQIAEEYRASVDPRVYEALINYDIKVTD